MPRKTVDKIKTYILSHKRHYGFLEQYPQILFASSTGGIGFIANDIYTNRLNAITLENFFLLVALIFLSFYSHRSCQESDPSLLYAAERQIKKQYRLKRAAENKYKTMRWLTSIFKIGMSQKKIFTITESWTLDWVLLPFTQRLNFIALQSMGLDPVRDMWSVVYYIYDDNLDKLVPKIRARHVDHKSHANKNADGKIILGRTLGVNEGQIGAIFQRDDPTYIPDIEKDSGLHYEIKVDNRREYDNEMYKSIAGTQIWDRVNSRKIGVLAITTNKTNAFDDSDLDLLTNLATNIELCIQQDYIDEDA